VCEVSTSIRRNRMSKDEIRKTEETPKPMTDEESSEAVGGILPPGGEPDSRPQHVRDQMREYNRNIGR